MSVLNHPHRGENAGSHLDDIDWRASAACAGVDPAIFFPEGGAQNVQAKRVCAGCTVQAECLDDALKASYGAHGIWGGLSEHGRRPMLRGRRGAA